MNTLGLISLLAAMWMVNMAGLAMQLRRYQSKIDELQNAYRNGFIGVGMGKSRFKPRKIVLIVADQYGTVIESYVMGGITIFSNFKATDEFTGLNIDDIQDVEVAKSLKEPLNQASNLIKEEMG